jgi:enoyl-CoA hydratase/carnithine racemase
METQVLAARPGSAIAASFVASGVVGIRMENPETRNAMSDDSVTAMIDLLDQLAPDTDCRCIVLTGSGRGFCAGSNLKELAKMSAAGRSSFEDRCGELSQMIGAFPFPVIAAVHGFAIGGGLTLAASCDIVLTSPDAKWSLPEVPIGLFPAWGLAPVVARCGIGTARRIAWGVDLLDSYGALRAGLADEIVADPVDAAARLGAKLAALPAAHSACVKRYFSASPNGEAANRLSNQLFCEMCETPEGAATLRKYSSLEKS